MSAIIHHVEEEGIAPCLLANALRFFKNVVHQNTAYASALGYQRNRNLPDEQHGDFPVARCALGRAGECCDIHRAKVDGVIAKDDFAAILNQHIHTAHIVFGLLFGR